MDGFGDRLLMFDNTETDSLELLRFYPSLTAIAGFEDALHERVRVVGRLPDHAFPLIVAVERLEGDGALALVSTHTPGKRLSSFFERPGLRRGLNPAFVTGIATQVVQALAVLQSKGDDITHSALTPERVVVSSGGRVCVVEHVLGSALRQLNLSMAQLWREFGLVAPPDPSGALRLDARTDVFQVGVLTLEMLLGRRLSPLELKDRLPDLLDQWCQSARSQPAADRLKEWLERALQLGSNRYATAAEAFADLRDLPSESTASAFESLPTADVEPLHKRPFQPRLTTGQDAPMANVSASDDLPGDGAAPPMRPSLVTSENRRPESFPSESKTAGPRPLESPGADAATTKPAAAPAASRVAPVAARRMSLRVPGVPPWITALLAVIAIVEGGVIAGLLLRQPPKAPAAVATAPAAAVDTPPTDAAPALPVVPPPAVEQANAPSAAEDTQGPDPIEAAASKQRSGGVRLVSPITLNVLQGNRVLGSTADGPIVLTAGTHQLDLINTALGFSARRAVTFRAGTITSVDIPVPSQRVSVNAQPWAEVFIDNRPYGETPLANLNIPIGDHEFVFRHPQLGERRVTVTVRADQPTRVSTSFER